ncbi:Transcription factor iws1 [Zancudomyces culisetae]|uniref:Transcription factor iws1 n=1 Tax=Zancudomyces culisetae TaxID=1213189 RepID=A0A1R1PY23_ZANCU|nr:Transcription factor iws1 [Zancudomyces culisetae]|eukprot:OMH85864.1 Transcription factor iws1 [Zancudomyces culisetae]
MSDHESGKEGEFYYENEGELNNEMHSNNENENEIVDRNEGGAEEKGGENEEGEESEDEQTKAIKSMPKFKLKRKLERRKSRESEGGESQHEELAQEREHEREQEQEQEQREKEYKEGEEEEGDNAYPQEHEDERRSKKRRKRRRDEEDEEGERGEPQEITDPKQLEIIAINKEIDMALKSGKTSRRRKRDELDAGVDEEIVKLQEKMRRAAMEDFEANKEGAAAMHKVGMLVEVSRELGKSHLHEVMLENNILDTIRLWLEPLDDGALPGLDLQQEMLGVISRMPVRTEHLRDSGIGKIILFMSKCDRYPDRIKRQAMGLVQKWARPLLKRSSSFRDKVATMNADGGGVRRRSSAEDRQEGFLGSIQVQTGNSESGQTRRAIIPSKNIKNYTVMPKGSISLREQPEGKANNAMPDIYKRLKASFQKKKRPN